MVTICSKHGLEVKIGLHQRYVLSPLLFAVVMDVVSSGLPSKLLYADDIVLMGPAMEQLTWYTCI